MSTPLVFNPNEVEWVLLPGLVAHVTMGDKNNIVRITVLPQFAGNLPLPPLCQIGTMPMPISMPPVPQFTYITNEKPFTFTIVDMHGNQITQFKMDGRKWEPPVADALQNMAIPNSAYLALRSSDNRRTIYLCIEKPEFFKLNPTDKEMFHLKVAGVEV